jgi:periplasmic divalent cation tolerance protein
MYIVIFVTAKDKSEADVIARRLLEKKLIACANIVSSVHSMFWWQGKIDSCDEALIVMKAMKKNFAKITKEIHAVHSYETPEIIAMPIIAGDKKYLSWLKESSL